MSIPESGEPFGLRALRDPARKTEQSVLALLDLCCEDRGCCPYADVCVELFAQRGKDWHWPTKYGADPAETDQAVRQWPSGLFGAPQSDWLDYSVHMPRMERARVLA